MSRLKNILIALDQLANAIANGSPDETLSSRAHRARLAGKPGWRRVAGVIDRLFWWDKDHCRESWLAERHRRHLPREMWGAPGAIASHAGDARYEKRSKRGRRKPNEHKSR